MAENTSTKTIIPLNYETYLSLIEGSVGSVAYRHAYGTIGGERKDLVEGGKLSCAFFVSSLLLIPGWIEEVHLTVKGLVADLERSGWEKIEELKPGAVLVWEALQETDGHGHIGFYLGEGKAVSNDSKLSQVSLHHPTYGEEDGQPKRKVEAIYWNPKFEL